MKRQIRLVVARSVIVDLPVLGQCNAAGLKRQIPTEAAHRVCFRSRSSPWRQWRDRVLVGLAFATIAKPLQPMDDPPNPQTPNPPSFNPSPPRPPLGGPGKTEPGRNGLGL